jgi:hypothetical protein
MARDGLLLLVSDLSSPAREDKELLLPGRTILAPERFFSVGFSCSAVIELTEGESRGAGGGTIGEDETEADFVAKENFSKGDVVGRFVGLLAGKFLGILIPAMTRAIFSSRVSARSVGLAAADGKLLDFGNNIFEGIEPTDLDVFFGIADSNLNDVSGVSLSLSSCISSERFSRFNFAIDEKALLWGK